MVRTCLTRGPSIFFVEFRANMFPQAARGKKGRPSPFAAGWRNPVERSGHPAAHELIGKAKRDQLGRVNHPTEQQLGLQRNGSNPTIKRIPQGRFL